MSYGNYPDLKGVKKILVVRMRHLGDVLLTSPVFSILKKALPEAKIDVLINQESLPMLQGNPAISHFILFDRKKVPFFRKWKKEWRLYREIWKGKYDLVINLTEGDRGALAALFSRAAIKVGFDPEGKGFKFKKTIYTHMTKVIKNPRHIVERQLDALRCIGIFPEKEERELFFFIPEEARLRVESLVQEPFVILHPTSRWKFKCVPIKTMRALIQLLEKKGLKVVLTSGPDSEELKMAQQLECETVLNLAGKLTLKEMGALVKKAQAVISVDTVIAHMASAFKTPLVVIFGPTSDKEWGPWIHPKSRVVFQPYSCRPCLIDGCGGSKVSDCLLTLSAHQIFQNFQNLTEREGFEPSEPC